MSSDEEVEEGAVSTPQAGMARSLGMRMQKKLLGMTTKSKTVVKAFVDDNTGGYSMHIVCERNLESVCGQDEERL